MTLDQYFGRRDSPMKESPVGKLMIRILGDFPEMPYDDARERAREALVGIGGEHRLPLAYNRFLHARSSSKAIL